MRKSQIIILISGLMLFCTYSTSFCMNNSTERDTIKKSLFEAITKATQEELKKILESSDVDVNEPLYPYYKGTMVYLALKQSKDSKSNAPIFMQIMEFLGKSEQEYNQPIDEKLEKYDQLFESKDKPCKKYNAKKREEILQKLSNELEIAAKNYKK